MKTLGSETSSPPSTLGSETSSPASTLGSDTSSPAYQLFLEHFLSTCPLVQVERPVDLVLGIGGHRTTLSGLRDLKVSVRVKRNAAPSQSLTMRSVSA